MRSRRHRAHCRDGAAVRHCVVCAVTRAVVDELALPIEPDAVRLRGATGSAVVSAVRVKTLEIGELLIESMTMPVVADAFGGAEGVLGGAGLQGKRIVVEFHRDRIDIARSHRQLAPQGFSVVPFKYRPAQGMRVSAMVDSIKVIALIDTGAQVTVGNPALRAALARRQGGQDGFGQEIVGVTETSSTCLASAIRGSSMTVSVSSRSGRAAEVGYDSREQAATARISIGSDDAEDHIDHGLLERHRCRARR